MYGTIKPLLLLLHLVVEHGKHPYFPSLQPDELVSVEHTSVTIQTAEISAIFMVLRILKPERQTAVQKLILVLLRKLLKV
jgi:hypothetical protein